MPSATMPVRKASSGPRVLSGGIEDISEFGGSSVELPDEALTELTDLRVTWTQPAGVKALATAFAQALVRAEDASVLTQAILYAQLYRDDVQLDGRAWPGFLAVQHTGAEADLIGQLAINTTFELEASDESRLLSVRFAVQASGQAATAISNKSQVTRYGQGVTYS